MHRIATRTAQTHFKETKEDSKNCIVMMKGRLAHRNRENILNKDQTPVAYSFHANKTLETRGTETIQVQASTMDTKHVTIVATVTTSGKMLPLLMI